MGIKINNGLILRDSNYEETFDLLNSIRVKSKDVAKKNMVSFFSNEILFIFDMYKNSDLIDNLSYRDRFINKAKNFKITDYIDYFRKIKTKIYIDNVRFPLLDFTFHCSFKEINHGDKKDILLLYNFENGMPYYEYLLELGFEDYSWNDTGLNPENVDEESYKKRGMDWKSIGLNYGSTPSTKMLSLDIVNFNDYETIIFERDKIEKYCLSDNKRKDRVSIFIASLNYASKNKKADMTNTFGNNELNKFSQEILKNEIHRIKNSIELAEIALCYQGV